MWPVGRGNHRAQLPGMRVYHRDTRAAKAGDEDRAAIARGDHMHGIDANADAVCLLGRAAAQIEGDQTVGGDIGDVERLAIGGKPQPVDALPDMPRMMTEFGHIPRQHIGDKDRIGGKWRGQRERRDGRRRGCRRS